MYAIRKKTKAAVQVCAACGGTYEKAIQEPIPASSYKEPEQTAGVQPYPDHLRQFCDRDRTGDAVAVAAHCQPLRADEGDRRHVHGHQRHLRDRSGRAGYLDPVHGVRAGGDPGPDPGGRPGSGDPDQLFCAGHAAPHGLPGSAGAGGERLGRRLRPGQRCAEDRGGAGGLL